VRRLALALLALAAVLVPAVASAQDPPAAQDVAGWLAGTRIISGGVRFSLEPLVVFEASLEQPIFTSPDGWRAGGVVSVRGSTDFTSGEARILAGVTATFPAGGVAIQAQVLWREVLTTSASARGSPELTVAFATGF